MRRKLSIQELAHRHASRRVPHAMTRSIIWLHNIRSAHNVGSAFRSADGFGVGEVWLSGYTPTPPRPDIHKTALGADRTMAWRWFVSADQAFEEARSRGLTSIAIEQTTDSVDLPAIGAVTDPVVFLFGNEVTGLDDELLARADRVVEIPQFGKKHSLNVSVAVGIALYGLYSAMESHLDGS